jgi:hypothetical protein
LIQINTRGNLTKGSGRSGKIGRTMMAIPHWLISLAIFAGLGAFIAFAFRQGQRVKPDRNKDPDDWTRLTGGGGGDAGI